MEHGLSLVVSYRAKIRVAGQYLKSMTYQAVSPSRRIGYGVSGGPVAAVSSNYYYWGFHSDSVIAVDVIGDAQVSFSWTRVH